MPRMTHQSDSFASHHTGDLQGIIPIGGSVVKT